MFSFPGLYDTRRTALAWHRYHDAPSDATRSEVEHAKRLDRREILLWEVGLGTVLIWAAVALARRTKIQS